MPNTRAELLNGVVHMASPLYVSHGIRHAHIIGWLAFYRALTPNVELCDNTSLRLDKENEVQPDGMLFFTDKAIAGARISDEGYVEGSPELIVEVAVSSVAYDLHDKRLVYQRCGVQEYLIWHVPEHRVLWFVLENGEYTEQHPDENGMLHSHIFPGLVLDVPALLNGQLAQVLAAVQAGGASVQTEKAHE
jgi:Uma2 family endonuclease